ncbi:MAG TPA: thiolase family protein [Acidimicrobiales bacterium]|jgi:acetyl-CoA acetyltransferase family protein|nr:thiolase family protein [Acidimicrobiales bacterium]
MPDAVIVSAVRTAIGTARKGTLSETEASVLAQPVIEEALARTGLAPTEIDDLILAESLYGGGVVARYVAVVAGMDSVPGLAHNRHCASGLAAVQTASASIMAGMDQAIIAGGVQASSLSPRDKRRVAGTDDWEDWMSLSHPNSAEAPALDMSITVGWNTAQRVGASREDMDAWALRSHERAIAAIDEGRFAAEIVPIKVTTRDGSVVVFDTDEHPRRGSTMEKLASLKPLHPEIEDFSITAGNASGINDAASALVVTSDAFARDHGLAPLATVRSWASVGVEPKETGMAPTLAIPKALERAGLSLSDVDLYEINEAFASVPVACARVLDIDEDIINISGSGCSLGHPIAATGARMLTTLIYDLARKGGGIGVAAMCAGGGMGSATVIDVAPG